MASLGNNNYYHHIQLYKFILVIIYGDSYVAIHPMTLAEFLFGHHNI